MAIKEEAYPIFRVTCFWIRFIKLITSSKANFKNNCETYCKIGNEIQWSPFSFPLIIREIIMIRFEWFNRLNEGRCSG